MEKTYKYPLAEAEKENLSIEQMQVIFQNYFEEHLIETLEVENESFSSRKNAGQLKVKAEINQDFVQFTLPTEIFTDSEIESLTEKEAFKIDLLRDNGQAPYNMAVYEQNCDRPGSASAKGAEKNIPKISDDIPNYQWNHDCVEFPKAIEIAYKTDLSPQVNPFDPKKRTNINVFQLDTGYSTHNALLHEESYIDEIDDPIRSVGFKKDNLGALDPLSYYKLSRKNRQKPGHGTATAFTFVGKEGLPSEDWTTIEDLPFIKNYPALLTENFNKGLFPYVNFYPIKAAKYVGFSNGFRGWLTRKLLKIKTDYPYSMIEALRHARKFNAHVITMSIGGSINSRKLLKEVKENYNSGIITVCAAGNSKLLDRLEDEITPSDYTETICVAALEPREKNGEIQIVPWTKSCDGYMTDVSAPGKYIYTAFKLDKDRIPGDVYSEEFSNGDLFKWGGATSQATVHVAAAASLWRHYFDKILSNDSFYQTKKSRIVEAFRFAIFQSSVVPGYWMELNVAEYKGILNVTQLIALSNAPHTDLCKKFIESIETDEGSRKRRYAAYQEFMKRD